MSGHMLKSLVMSLYTCDQRLTVTTVVTPGLCLAQCGTNMHKNVQEDLAESVTNLAFARGYGG